MLKSYRDHVAERAALGIPPPGGAFYRVETGSCP